MISKNIRDNILDVNEINVGKLININDKINQQVTLNKNVLSDIELFESFSDSETVVDVFKKFSVLKDSAKYINEILSNPVYDKSNLLQRQAYIKNFNTSLVSQELKDIEGLFKSIEWLLTERDDELKTYINTVYFTWWIFEKGNSSPTALTIKNVYYILLSPTIGILSPIIYFLLPYLILKMKFKFDISFKTYISTLYQVSVTNLKYNQSSFLKTISLISYVSSIFFYFQGTLQSIETSKNTLNISNLISGHVNSLFTIYNKYRNLYEKLRFSNNPFYSNQQIINIQEFDNYGSIGFGKKLSIFKNLQNVIPKIKVMVCQLEVFDAFNSIKQTINATKMNKVLYDNSSKKPYIYFNDAFHINLQYDKSVKNIFNTNCKKCNSIITGPNAAGKSTFIKTILINIILSQTIGFSCSESAIITPFEYIASQINIPDCKGSESLFEAEMYRCKNIIDYIENNKNKKCMIFMDELFNSTNVIEGISGAYSILKNLSLNKNINLIITTHFGFLTKLHKYSNFNLYKFDCQVNDEKIEYPYKISKGVSKQYIALEILKNNNYNVNIISEAIAIKKKLLNN